ncbi:hypothetical protein C2S51_036579 [Perilla frutescens var. frutescens]|nr:hypothetical protein C2S51_036579 [Perilla frutescens var. frutescens]
MDEAPNNDLLGILLDSNARFIKEKGNKNGGMSVEDVMNECEQFYTSTWLDPRPLRVCWFGRWCCSANIPIGKLEQEKRSIVFSGTIPTLLLNP